MTRSPREGKNRRSLRLKVELLEAALDIGHIPEDLKSFKTRQAIAAWTDKERGLTPWSSPNVSSKSGRNPDLAARLTDSLQKMQKLQHGRRPLREVTKLSKSSEKHLKQENLILAQQNEKLLGELEAAYAEIRRLSSQKHGVAGK